VVAIASIADNCHWISWVVVPVALWHCPVEFKPCMLDLTLYGVYMDSVGVGGMLAR